MLIDVTDVEAHPRKAGLSRAQFRWNEVSAQCTSAVQVLYPFYYRRRS
jgi:hypothetical protein